MGRIDMKRAYDDPYRVLAAHIVSIYTPYSIKRILTSSSYIKSLIVSEAKLMDISGAFLDCIDQEIISNDRIRNKNAHLRRLGEFYYDELDIKRLRDEIRRFVIDMGIDIEE